MSELRALLFDVDGTLAETERDGHRAAFNQAFGEHRLPWHWGERLYGALLAVTGGKERIAHYAAEYDPDWLAKPGSEAAIAAIHASKNRHYQDLLRNSGIALRRGLRPLLAEARMAGLQLGIVTTTSRGNLDGLLAATLDADTRDAFRVRVAGEDVRRKKPDPECYTRALAALNLRPDQALAVEDSRNGLLAARGAGLQVLIVRSFYFAEEGFGEAFAVADDFRDLRLTELRRRFERRCGDSVSDTTHFAVVPDTVLVQ
ncbi:MAG: HAD-IA family hydrolase [Nevskiales bacterium]